MTQTSLFDLPASRPRKRGQVTRTSVEAGRAVNRDARSFEAVEGVAFYHRQDRQLTSAELAAWVFDTEKPTTDQLLYVRRGLSDALARGFVEHAGERPCAVSGRTCVTWKLRTR